MTGSPQEIAERRIQQVYDEANAFADAHGGVEPHGMNILLGPPIVGAKLMIVSLQGGGKDKTRQRTWPPRLLYAHAEIDIDPETGQENRFGAILRKDFNDFGLSAVLESCTVASNIVFPQWPRALGGLAGWRRSAPAARLWEAKSREWLIALIDIIRPSLIATYGVKPFFEITRQRKINGFIAESKFASIDVIGCGHLSQGTKIEERHQCMHVIKQRISATGSI